MKKQSILLHFTGSVLFLAFIFTMIHCKNKSTRIYPLSESWEKVIPHQQIPQGLKTLSAEECGKCHKEHYKEWKTSTHALAWSDAQFQAEIKKESSPFFCINCHIPLEDQQEYIIEGKIDNNIYTPSRIKNPHFDSDLQSEAITCAVCHIRDGAIIAMNENPSAPHKTIKNVAFLSEQLCINCHNINEKLNDQLVCSFETGDEWKKGKYASSKNCISCHMDTISRPLMKGFSIRKSHFHSFPGSGIPKEKGLKSNMLNGLEMIHFAPKDIYKIGDNIRLKLRLKNKFAGHRVPTGDPERYFMVNEVLLNNNQDTLAHRVSRIGEKWQWFPKAIKLEDNNFNIDEERYYTLDYKFVVSGKYHWDIKVTKHRMDEENARYNKLDDTYPLFIEVFHESGEVEVRE